MLECYNPTGTGMQMYGIYCRFKITLLFFNGSSRENKKDVIWFSPPGPLLPPGCCNILVCACPVSKSCLTLCNPMDYSLPGSSVHGVSQARILEWVAFSSSRDSSGGHYLFLKKSKGGGMVTAPGDKRITHGLLRYPLVCLLIPTHMSTTVPLLHSPSVPIDITIAKD